MPHLPKNKLGERIAIDFLFLENHLYCHKKGCPEQRTAFFIEL
jgi:hypothetical protein